MTYHIELANKIRGGEWAGNLWLVVPKNAQGQNMTNVGVYESREAAVARIAELNAK